MLTVTGVSKKFGSKTALSNINLNVGDGEFVSLLGPSGCGKTTLLRMIAGLEHPTVGTLHLKGQDITKVPAHKRNIHTVFQRYALFPHMTVAENIGFGMRCKKASEPEIKRRVDEMLDLANLSGQGGRSITTLSGGEQQRVALVRALANMPDLLLLDEPLGALDMKLRLQLQTELVAIQRRVRTTFVFVTHDQQEALNMSDRIAVMNRGVVEQIGTPLEIYEFPKSFFAASFVGGINTIPGVLKEVEGGRCQVESEGLGAFWVEPQNGNRRIGASGQLCLRPEKLTIFSRKPTTVENTVEGTIKSQTYLGTHTQFEVTLKNGRSVSVFQQNTQKLSKKVFQVGDRVHLGWQTALSHFFASETP